MRTLWITTSDSELNDPNRKPRVDEHNASQLVSDQLSKQATFDYLTQPLSDVLEDIAFSFELEVENELKPESLAKPIVMSLKGISRRSALSLLLYRQSLSCEARGDKLVIMEVNEPADQEGIQSP